ncbi:ATP-binding protein [Streptomyces boninensis]|uniref:ATP-binding protein n=1 Tax=Streptomyces boninensis TaxID=2039455 RepID=UPI003B222293
MGRTAAIGPGGGLAAEVASAACTLPATAVAVPEARSFAAAVLSVWRVPEEVGFGVRIIVSELVGNAVRHSGSAHVSLRLTCTGAVLRVEVSDAGAWRPAAAPAEQQDAGQAEAGRGLLLVRAYADSTGIIRSAAGTRAWAQLTW